ncbi:MAG: hypothetical protein AMXMBFR64_55410 [Myxococcales bacterium]
MYDPALMDDQLILGIKGTLSVVELRVMRMRLVQGMRSKAARGELYTLLPPGYELDGDRRPVMDPNERVRNAIADVFAVFRKTWSARQTLLLFHGEDRLVPVRKHSGNRATLVWQLPTQSYLTDMLSNPWYAGAYVWGRRRTELSYRDGVLVRRTGRKRRPEECDVLLRDHHDGYITWEQFEEHRRIMSRNSRVIGGSDASPVRRGGGLLVGLLRCGRCGRMLHVHYWRRSGSAGEYLCGGTYQSGGEYCLSFAGRGVDQAFSAEILRVISPWSLAASEAALERRAEDDDARRRAVELHLRQAEYEAQRSFEQYNEADPRNRLVAAELERRWNVKLEELGRIRSSLEALPTRRVGDTPEVQKTIAWLGEHFDHVWTSDTCTPELRKQNVRTLIEEVIANYDDDTRHLRFTIHWKGGAHSHLDVTKPAAGKAQATSDGDLDVIAKLAVRYGDDDIAHVLTRLGRKTGKGLRWTRERVKSARSRAGIAGRTKTLEDPDLLNMNAAARYCGVSDTTIRRLVEARLVANHQTVPWAPWEVPRADLDAEPVQRIVRHLRSTGRLVLDLGCSTSQMELLVEFQGGSNDR